jgi:N-acetylmuramoyl-L-alanine amidase
MQSPRAAWPLLLVLACGPVAGAFPAAQSWGGHPAAFAHAERLREALEGRPEQQRTRLQYQRVLDAYRAIYHSDPASPRADASIAAVADLLAEEGRVFQDQKALHDAIGQYEFLRRQYPASRYRFSALLTEGEIYQRDLGDYEQAKSVYLSFLRVYPQSPLGEEARSELRTIRREETAARARPGTRPYRTTTAPARPQTPSRPSPPPSSRSAPEASTSRAQNQPSSSAGSAIQEGDIPPSSSDAGPPDPADDTQGSDGDEAAMNAPPPPRRSAVPLITGIRHWSTPDSTRVAIDLEEVVRYQAARVSNPDRIFFDLYGARLSPELSGRPVEVTGDSFLTRIRAAQTSANTTRIVLDVSSVTDYSAFFLVSPTRLIIDVHGVRGGAPAQTASNVPPPNSPPAPGSSAAPHRQASAGNSQAATPADTDDGSLSDVAKLGNQPNRVPATRHPTTAPVAAAVPGAGSARTSPPPRGSPVAPKATHAGDDVPPAEDGATGVPGPVSPHGPNSMVRALGLKINRIVIDAGHGGHDSGTLGPGGLEEKDVVLDVALRLGRLLHQRLGADVIYTRSDDTFIPLETRTAIANQAQADLFISIHANSSPDTSARGVEVYYLNFTSSADALEVAARENASSDESIHQLSDLVKKIALQDKIKESSEFAAEVDQSLYAGLSAGNPGLRDRGVKKAPFVVLIGANMPSILAEISFLTNPEDAAELRQGPYRQRIAESLYRGVSRYVSSLNGVRVAQASARPETSE